MLERCSICDIVDYNNRISSSIVTCCYCSESFLACCVPLELNIIREKNFTICILIFLPKTWTFFNLKSTPIEFIIFELNWFSWKFFLNFFLKFEEFITVYLTIKQDFPTPESPSKSMRNKWSLLIFKLIILLGIYYYSCSWFIFYFYFLFKN